MAILTMHPEIMFTSQFFHYAHEYLCLTDIKIREKITIGLFRHLGHVFKFNYDGR